MRLAGLAPLAAEVQAGLGLAVVVANSLLPHVASLAAVGRLLAKVVEAPKAEELVTLFSAL